MTGVVSDFFQRKDSNPWEWLADLEERLRLVERNSTGGVGDELDEHEHDHDDLNGLGDDDHTQYLLANGTRELTADWDAGSHQVRAETFRSDVGTGTAPLVVASTTLVTNLNADLLDGNHASAFATSGHNHDHGALTGLGDDDHTIYLLADGTRALTADWDAGSHQVRAETFQSDVGTGTAPLTVASTTLVTNLNADLLDGNHASAFATSGHNHDHGALTGLGDDDHGTVYPGIAQTETISGDWTFGADLTLQANLDMEVSGTQRVEVRVGDTLLDIDHLPDGTAASSIRFFRTTNTSGAKTIRFYKGDNTATLHAQIGVDGEDSYLQIGGGNVGIGIASAYSLLQVGDDSSGNNWITIGRVGTAQGGIQWYRAGTAVDAQIYMDANENLRISNDFGDPIILEGGDVGIEVTPDTRLDIGDGALEFTEMTEPASPASNDARVFSRDDGSGNTQLCAKFSDGTVEVLGAQGQKTGGRIYNFGSGSVAVDTSYDPSFGDFEFNISDFPTNQCTFRVTAAANGGTMYVQLYDVTGTSAAATLSTTSTSRDQLDTNVTLTHGHIYRIRVKGSTSQTDCWHGAYLEW